MTTLSEDMKIGRRTSGAALPLRNRGLEPGRRLIRRAQSHQDGFKPRRTIRGLDRLDERLLKDVGLFREHPSSGATRVRRR